MRAAVALQDLDDGDVDGRAAEIAAHYHAAGEQAAPEIAVAAHLRAAGVALRRLAFEEAVAHAERALTVPPPENIGLAEALLTLAEAQMSSGEDERAAETCERAAQVATALGRADLLARAALTLSGPTWGRVFESGGLRRRAVRLLEAALDLAGHAESVEIVRVLGRLATELILTDGNTDRRRELIERTEAMAERLGSSDARFYAAKERAFYAWGFYEPNVLEPAVEHLRELAERRGDQESVLLGLLPTPSLRAATATKRTNASAATPRSPRRCAFRTTWRSLSTAPRACAHGWAARQGRGAADRCGAAGRALGRRDRHQNTRGPAGGAAPTAGPRGGARRGPRGRRVHDAGDACLAWRPRVALRPRRARRRCSSGARRARSRPLRGDPRNGVWIEGIRGFAETSIALGDARHALTLYELLEPYVDRMFVVGNGVPRVGARRDGTYASLLGEWSLAVKHLERALAANVALRAQVLVTHTLFHQAELVLRTGAPGNSKLARESACRAREPQRMSSVFAGWSGAPWTWRRAHKTLAHFSGSDDPQSRSS